MFLYRRADMNIDAFINYLCSYEKRTKNECSVIVAEE